MHLTIRINHSGYISFKKPGQSFYTKLGDYMVSSTQRKINSGIAPANAPLTTAVKQGGKTLRDRGQLLSSITQKATDTHTVVGTNHVAARISHFGGTISAKRAKMLWIPANPLTRTMQRRYGFRVRDCIEGMRRDGWNLWRPKRKDGSPKNVMMAKKGETEFPLFILRHSVVIPARPFLFTDEMDRKLILQMFSREVVQHERNA